MEPDSGILSDNSAQQPVVLPSEGNNSGADSGKIAENPPPISPPLHPVEPVPPVQPLVSESETGNGKAGFIVRIAAYFIDSLILGLATAIILSLAGASRDFIQRITGLLLTFAYFFILTGMQGATPGKRFYHLKVVKTNGSKVDFASAFLREIVGKILSGLVLGLGFLWIIWDKNKQGWHDKIAGTYVEITKPIGQGKKILAYIIIFALPILAILGILAAVVLVSINPSEQMSEARDAGRKSTVMSLGASVMTYGIENGKYPDLTNWDKEMVPKYLSAFPQSINSTDKVCAGGSQVNGYCYNSGKDISGKDEIVVYALLTSKENISKCPSKDTYVVYSSLITREGLVCGVPQPGIQPNFIE